MKRSILYSVFIFLFWISPGQGEEIQIRILHVNDFHGFAEPYKPMGSDEMLGGIAYLASRVEELRQEKPSLLLSAGDMIQGNNWANLFQGESVIELMKKMKFDAMVVGNHEFDFGQDVLRKRISEADFTVLGANVEGLDRLKPYVIKELKGIRVAIIGVVAEDVPETTHPKNVAGLRFLSPLDVVEKYVKDLRNRTDLILILSHIGYPADRMIAERIKGVDVVVGGHSHTKITKPVRVGDTIIVQAWEHGKALGVLDLTLRDKKIIGFGGHLEEIRPKTGKEDQKVLALVEKYKQRMTAVLNEKVGESDVELNGERKDIRRRETNLGNLIADILRETSKADAAIVNGGTIRAGIGKGEIRVRDIYTTLPFDNYMVAIKLTGKQIWEALEHGVSGIEGEEGRFPQVSGLAFKFSPSGEKGSRIREIAVGGQPISLEKEYIVATNDFLAAGGDGYKAFGEAIKTSKDFSVIGGTLMGEKVVYIDPGKWLRDEVVEYIKQKGRIAPKVEGRILEIR
ncbi:MAG: bifunctional UDP-sugar hydrolase/5'-nucleotidase [Thermodesulfobacteriota bacterium]